MRRFAPFLVAFLALIPSVFSPNSALAAAGSRAGSCTCSCNEADPFRGRSPDGSWTLGAMMGLGLLDSSGGFGFTGHIAHKILERGFVPDINDQVYFEVEAGPLWLRRSTAWFYSTHLRWDFHEDAKWTYFAIGGVAGNFSPRELGDHATMLPRFGVGSLVRVAPLVTVRGEVSRELVAVGLSYSL